MSIKTVSFLLAMTVAGHVAAQFPAVESRGNSDQSKNQAQADLYFQLQQMQQEVQALRGIVEEQQHKLRKLNKQRMDDYLSLDKRISAMQGGGYTAPASQPAFSQNSPPSSPPAVAPSSQAPLAAPAGNVASGDERANYQAAYELVKKQRFDDALNAFRDFLLLYPKGAYAANAHYWMGELYLYKSDLSSAIAEFDVVVKNYPQHRKAPDALFKLGKAHNVRGDGQTARILLNRVISDYRDSGSNAVQLAKDYLANEM